MTTAVYLLNRAPTKSVKGMTPYEAWHERKPSVQHLRTFGCTAHVKKVWPGQSKLADSSKQMVFIGFKAGSKAYRMYDPESRKLVITRDVVFEEDRPWDWSSSGSVEDVEQSPLIDLYPDQQDQAEIDFAAENIATAVNSATMAAKSPGATPTVAQKTAAMVANFAPMAAPRQASRTR